MTISTDPDTLLVFNEASGTTIPNLNTANADSAIGVTSGGTADYLWNQDSGSYEGYLDILDSGAGTHTDMTFITNAETFPTTLDDESLAIRFNVSSRDGSTSYLLAQTTSFDPGGGISVHLVNGSGDFNLVVHAKNIGGEGVDTSASSTFQGLSYNTDYALAVSVDRSDSNNCVARFKLNAETEYNPADSYQGTFGLNATHPHIGRGYQFDSYYGVVARLYYFAYWRGYAISSADLALCNSSPSTTIPLWPSGGGSIIPQAMYHYRNNSGSGL